MNDLDQVNVDLPYDLAMGDEAGRIEFYKSAKAILKSNLQVIEDHKNLWFRTLSVETERDELKVENERQALQFKEWQASHHANYVQVADERDQLQAEVDRLKHEKRLLTEHNEFLASSGSRLEPELRAVKDALGLDFTASVSGEVVPAIEALRKSDQRYRYLRAKGLALEGHDFISFDEIADYRIDVAMGKAKQ